MSTPEEQPTSSEESKSIVSYNCTNIFEVLLSTFALVLVRAMNSEWHEARLSTTIHVSLTITSKHYTSQQRLDLLLINKITQKLPTKCIVLEKLF